MFIAVADEATSMATAQTAERYVARKPARACVRQQAALQARRYAGAQIALRSAQQHVRRRQPGKDAGAAVALPRKIACCRVQQRCRHSARRPPLLH